MATAGPDMYSAGSASVEPSGSSALTSLLASSLASQLQQQPAGPAIEGGRPPGDPTVQIFRSTASALAARNAKRLQQLSSDGLPSRSTRQSSPPQHSPPSQDELKTHRTKRPLEERKARNRLAQSEYRERQKEKHQEAQHAVKHLNQQVEDLQAEVAKLRRQNADLASQGSLSPAASATPSKHDSTSELTADNTQQAPWMCQANEDVYDSICFMLSKSRISCDEPPLAKEEIEACPVDGILDQKQEFLRGVALHLKRYDATASPHVLEELRLMMGAKNKMYSNSMYTGIAARNAQTALALEREYHQTVLRRHGAVPAEHWHTVATRTAFTEAQKAQLVGMHQQLQQVLSANRAERRHLIAQLQDGLPTEPDGDALAGRYILGCQCLDQLRQNLKQEHEAVCRFCLRIREEVLTPYQHAVLEVASVPFRPNLQGICAALAGSAPPAAMLHTCETASHSPRSGHDRAHSSGSMSGTEAPVCDLYQLDELDIPSDPFEIDVLGTPVTYACM